MYLFTVRKVLVNVYFYNLFNYYNTMSYFNTAYNSMFKPNHLTLCILFAIEAYEGSIPKKGRTSGISSTC
jgi:hypothetical protein